MSTPQLTAARYEQLVMAQRVSPICKKITDNMSAEHLDRRSYLIKIVIAVALSILAITASAQEAAKNATKQNGSALSPSIQNQSMKKNASFATSFRNKGSTQPSRAKVSCAKEIDLANSK